MKLDTSCGAKCDKKYGECSNKKNYYNKRHIASQNTPPRFEHTYPFFLATF